MVMPFNPYTVSDSLAPVDANGLFLVPSHSFANALPAAHYRYPRAGWLQRGAKIMAARQCQDWGRDHVGL